MGSTGWVATVQLKVRHWFDNPMTDSGRERRVGSGRDVFATATCYASPTGRERPEAVVAVLPRSGRNEE